MLPERPGDHFEYREWLVSDDHPEVAKKMELTEQDKLKIFYQCNILEVVRSKCEKIYTRILSGKRIIELNDLVGGGIESDHLYTGEKCATDFCFYYDNFLLWNAYYFIQGLAPIGFGQLIIYLNTDNFAVPRFIHFSLPTTKHQGEILVTINDDYYTRETAIEQYPELGQFLRIPQIHS